MFSPTTLIALMAGMLLVVEPASAQVSLPVSARSKLPRTYTAKQRGASALRRKVYQPKSAVQPMLDRRKVTAAKKKAYAAKLMLHSLANRRKTKAHKKKGHVAVPAVVDEPPSIEDPQEFKEQLPPIMDNAETEDDPIVHVTIGLTEIEATDQHPSFVVPTLPASEKTPLLAQQVQSLSDDLKIEDVIPEIKSVSVTCHKSQVEALQTKANVEFAEITDDVVIYEDNNYLNGETIPKGVDMIHGALPPHALPAHARYNGPTQCSDPDSIKVAVLDGGIDAGHWDFKWCGINPLTGQGLPGRKVKCIGEQFLPDANVQNGEDWYNSKRSHGVHVAGSIGASGVNGKGVVGAIPDERFCLMVVRVFGDDGRISLGQLQKAILHAAQNGAKVINMSLGTKRYLTSLHNTIKQAKSEGAILVGSAGNRNENAANYPATFEECVGVAAVDNDRSRAWFSNFGNYVAISAPGVSQLSTDPRWDDTPPTVIKHERSDSEEEGDLFQYSEYIGIAGVQGSLEDCTNGCPNHASGHICLVEKTATQYHVQARRCINSGGIGMIVINDTNDPLRGRMEVTGSIPKIVDIPVVGVRSDVGAKIKGLSGDTFSMMNPMLKGGQLTAGYSRKSGTSMAAPLVTGALGLIWRECPRCSDQEVLDCVLGTAEDLGNPTHFGHGLLQTDRAAQCLASESCCSGIAADTSQGQTSSPTQSPSLSSTSSPTTSPTGSPSVSPIVQSSEACLAACATQHAFCAYRVDAVCNQRACTGLCAAAVNTGKISRDFLTQCREEWCPQEVPCGSTESCDTEKSSCDAAC